jgi:excinuclease ABC subunit A
MKLDRYKTHDIEIVIDRIESSPFGGRGLDETDKRLAESIKTAMHHGDDIMMVIEHESNEVRYFSRTLMCPTSGISYPNPEPNNFSFNSPKGACEHCNGLGTLIKLIKKNYSKSKIIYKSWRFCSTWRI